MLLVKEETSSSVRISSALKNGSLFNCSLFGIKSPTLIVLHESHARYEASKV